MFSRLTIRAKITAGSLIVAAVIFAIALIAVRAEFASVITNATTTLAEQDLVSFEEDILANPTETVDDPGSGLLLVVRNPQGDVQVDTMPHGVKEAVENQPPTPDGQYSVETDGVSYVVASRTVSTTAGDWQLWSARSLESSMLAVEGVNTVLLIGALLLLVAFGFASWGLATAALRPVERLRQKAEHLGTEAFGADPAQSELPVGPANDEIAELASTLNAFLGRVRRGALREKQIVSDAAHELRTPLAALKTQLELAHDDFGNADSMASHIVSAEASVARLSSLATNLLELSRLESEAGEGHAAPVRSSTTEQLVSELMGCIDRARMLALPADVEVGFTVDQMDAANYGLAQDGFGRIIDNLVSNAIAATPAGGEVTVTLRDSAEALHLDVHDTGPGMPEEFVARAFERFSRPDDSRTSSTGGSGLGLALVHAIASAADGTVSLTNSAPGLTVTVRIPKM